jgi:hypothetical protein
MTDADTQAAIDALARRVRDRDDAVRTGGDLPDAELFAREFMLSLLGRQWRTPEPKVTPAWKAPRRVGSGLPKGEEAAALVRQAHAKAEAARAAFEAQHRNNHPKDGLPA